MANPPSTMTVTVDIPILTNISQSVRDLETEVQNLRTEIRDLRTDFSTRLEALEAHLDTQQANQSQTNATTVSAQETANDTTLQHEDPSHQEEDDANENLHDDLINDEDANTALVIDPAHEREDDEDERQATNINRSSPSIDEGITAVVRPEMPPPAAGKKRKRTVRDVPACDNYLGFMVRSSDTQLAKTRGRQAKEPSRSESPFDNNVGHEPSSDDMIPATASQAPPAMSQPSAPSRRRETKKAEEAGLDEFVAEKQEDFTISRYTGRIRKQTKKPDGFIATPQF